ncbi:MAG: DNA mismatch repair endonuclease MutL [Treponema sp.]|uniref:DNA mismatch repair endonuclease MutL n=1 Tax=Treponema sp. TaxID=166 RepID=UPI001B449EE2|nr:DNA mismatch repair endonuclease MutL [Treponema sp.]MBP5403114.1 DNA mismatch repair endonuclease MutL [Treponema sp.]MBR5934333.1 DNA mismatch repair endonuclease MutL [Treponema sp.]
MSTKGRIKVLPPEVARKIAAGEVIDRPNAIIRELMDNAIDSGADSITVEITDGGIEKIRVSDNGSGMTKEDLEIAATSHATSKISTEQDLLSLTTLGFRGEALSSIASVSNLTINSGNYQCEASLTDKNKITECSPIKGTVVKAENLFENFPARRMFLKRAATEGKMCLNTFIEKSLPFYNIEFRFYSDGELKLDLPKTDSLQKRFTDACSYSSKKDLFFTLENFASDSKWNYKLIICDPSIYRSDRKEISIFVNSRKIQEYSLMQAIEYGCQGYFPNGTHPVACLFITINSDLVDFNIHPAKKEVRFKDISELHHSISTTTQKFYRSYAIKSLNSSEDASFYENTFTNDFFKSGISDKRPSYSSSGKSQSYSSSLSASALSDESSDMRSIFMDRSKTSAEINSYSKQFSPSGKTDVISDGSVKYLGTALGVFLVAEKDDTLYLIDQHAAHERILYNKILNSDSMPQKLLVPYEFETESPSDDSYLESVAEPLSTAGFLIENIGNGKWQINAVHERWKGSEDELVKALIDDKTAPDKILNHIAATTACKAAVKDGYYLDEQTALELCEKALELEDPHCPHGRPIWTAITREKLFELVKRT